MKNETFKIPVAKQSNELHWLQIIQTIVLFTILAINLYFLSVVYQGAKDSAKNKRAVDLIIEVLGHKNVITEEESDDIKEEVKEVVPDGGQEKETK